MGHLSCPVCPHGFLADVRELQHRIASVLSRSLYCPICSEELQGLSALHVHLEQHLTLSLHPSLSLTNFPVHDQMTRNTKTSPASVENFTPLRGSNDDRPIMSVEGFPSLEKLEIKEDILSAEYSPMLSRFDINTGSPSSPIVALQNTSRAPSRCSNVEEVRMMRDASLPPSVEQHSCEHCGVVFSSEHFLQLHKDIIHKHSDCFEVCCKICHEKFDNLESYRNHVRENHSECRYLCEECPKTFKLKGSLVVHRRMYHDDSPSVCQTCNKRFPSHTRRKFHERRYHSSCSKSIFKGKSPLYGPPSNVSESIQQPDESSNHCIQDARKSLENLIEETKMGKVIMKTENNIKGDFQNVKLSELNNKSLSTELSSNSSCELRDFIQNAASINSLSLPEPKNHVIFPEIDVNLESENKNTSDGQKSDCCHLLTSLTSVITPRQQFTPAGQSFTVNSTNGYHYGDDNNRTLTEPDLEKISPSTSASLSTVQSDAVTTYQCIIDNDINGFSQDITFIKQCSSSVNPIVHTSFDNKQRSDLYVSPTGSQNKSNFATNAGTETASVSGESFCQAAINMKRKVDAASSKRDVHTVRSANSENSKDGTTQFLLPLLEESNQCSSDIKKDVVVIEDEGSSSGAISSVMEANIASKTSQGIFMELECVIPVTATDSKQWECDVCKKMFTTKYFLKKHKRLHTGETPYCCDECGKTFTFQQSYHKHILYHSDEKPHACSYCGRAFKEMSTLHNHVRIHTGEKPFICETCGKAFRQRVSYLVHLRIHTGVLPYNCTACGKSFRYKVSLRSHKCDHYCKHSAPSPSSAGPYQPDSGGAEVLSELLASSRKVDSSPHTDMSCHMLDVPPNSLAAAWSNVTSNYSTLSLPSSGVNVTAASGSIRTVNSSVDFKNIFLLTDHRQGGTMIPMPAPWTTDEVQTRNISGPSNCPALSKQLSLPAAMYEQRNTNPTSGGSSFIYSSSNHVLDNQSMLNNGLLGRADWSDAKLSPVIHQSSNISSEQSLGINSVACHNFQNTNDNYNMTVNESNVLVETKNNVKSDLRIPSVSADVVPVSPSEEHVDDDADLDTESFFKSLFG